MGHYLRVLPPEASCVSMSPWFFSLLSQIIMQDVFPPLPLLHCEMKMKRFGCPPSPPPANVYRRNKRLRPKVEDSTAPRWGTYPFLNKKSWCNYPSLFLLVPEAFEELCLLLFPVRDLRSLFFFFFISMWKKIAPVPFPLIRSAEDHLFSLSGGNTEERRKLPPFFYEAFLSEEQSPPPSF